MTIVNTGKIMHLHKIIVNKTIAIVGLGNNCWFLFVTIITIISMMPAFHSASHASQVFSFGVVPQQDKDSTYNHWSPVISYLEKASGYKIKLSTTNNITEFENKLASGEYDFAYMNPQQYVVFNKHTGYQALAKEKDVKIQGIIVVKKNNKITSIKQLKNKRIAFPSALAFGASILPRAELKRNNVHISPIYLISHDDVYRSVSRNKFIAGGGIVRTLLSSPTAVREKLRILHKTREHTPHAFASHPRIDIATRKIIRDSLINMHKTQRGKKILDNLQMHPLGKASDSDWDDIRQIRY